NSLLKAIALLDLSILNFSIMSAGHAAGVLKVGGSWKSEVRSYWPTRLPLGKSLSGLEVCDCYVVAGDTRRRPSLCRCRNVALSEPIRPPTALSSSASRGHDGL